MRPRHLEIRVRGPVGWRARARLVHTHDRINSQEHPMAPRPAPGRRADYRFFSAIPTRWFDNDVYGHVNNTVYYAYFDTAIAHLLMREGGLDPWRSPVIGVAVETGCRFHSSLRFPDTVHAGLRVGHLGGSSVRYEIGLFANEDDAAAAEGHFVHVFVERESQRPVPIPAPIRAALERARVDRPGAPQE